MTLRAPDLIAPGGWVRGHEISGLLVEPKRGTPNRRVVLAPVFFPLSARQIGAAGAIFEGAQMDAESGFDLKTFSVELSDKLVATHDILEEISQGVSVECARRMADKARAILPMVIRLGPTLDEMSAEILDDLRGDNPPRCKACGVAYIDHIGHQGLCYQLQVARAALRDIETVALSIDEAQLARMALDGLEASE